MIIQKKSNTPIWSEIYTYSKLPENLEKLDILAHNLWWVWNYKAQDLFKKISPSLWEETEGNPVMMTRALTTSVINEITENTELMAEIDAVYQDFHNYMKQPINSQRPSIAYFSMEYGLTNVLKIYSGGLGVLAGDYLKEASDSRVDMAAVGFLYKYGYFNQGLSADGQQIANYEAQDFTQLPIKQVMNSDGTPMILEVPFSTHSVFCYIWKVDVGHVSLYLMDSDIDMNSNWDREITHKLYGGDWENRMRQEYLLGVGGIMLLNKLGIKKDVYHMNEGHAALMTAQRLVDYVQNEQLSFDVALELVRASSLYTVHTPVPAGHDYFTEDLFGKYLGHFPHKLNISWQEFIDMGRENPGSNERFSMSVFALNTCQEANGVSLLHGKVSQKMFSPVWKGFFAEELHVGYVTNGVHLPSWASPEWHEFYVNLFGKDYLEKQDQEELWSAIQSVPNKEVWEVRKALKNHLVDFIRKNYGEKWIRDNGNPEQSIQLLEGINPDALLIGFGRRFATYKRAHLLFTDLDRLSRIVNDAEHPVQFIFTGKAHPADGGGQALIKHIMQISRRPEFIGKIIFLENYDIRLAKVLIAGVDIWMNTPTRPLEASGTSGEKAEMNGVLNLSVLDGWWYEGYRKNAGWALTDKRTFKDQQFQDKLDAATIYDLLEHEIIPLYFSKEEKDFSDDWVQYIKNSMNFIAPHYTMKRMLDDYYSKFYQKLAQRSAKLHENYNEKAKDIINWKRQVADNWDSMRVMSLEISGVDDSQTSMRHQDKESSYKITIDKGTLKCDLAVELVVAREEEDIDKGAVLKLDKVYTFTLKNRIEDRNVEEYSLENIMPERGHHKIGIRILPSNTDLPHRMDFAYVKWVPTNH
ncbi:alpha-glucan family phosphorylase [Porphyromonas pogonae]|uniref:alpha-glucan family phosphorylase n=1 Tax=Porphyromonas pogonae TaxID=867595 RepID=UPI002E79ACB8|nr:alpha-glucan family phosphorylase [Porphyromonas pogonae]